MQGWVDLGTLGANSLPKTVTWQRQRLRFEPVLFRAWVRHANHSAACQAANWLNKVKFSHHGSRSPKWQYNITTTITSLISEDDIARPAGPISARLIPIIRPSLRFIVSTQTSGRCAPHIITSGEVIWRRLHCCGRQRCPSNAGFLGPPRPSDFNQDLDPFRHRWNKQGWFWFFIPIIIIILLC